MRQTAADRHGARLRALIVVLWRGGLRVQEALALGERDLDSRRGSLLVRQGKGGRRREIGMDAWGWEQVSPWLSARSELPVGPLFCIIDGPTPGGRGRARACASSSGGSPPKRPFGAGSRRTSCAQRDPAPARPRQPRHDQHLPAGHRHRRDHRHRPGEARTDDVRHRRTPALSNPNSVSGSTATAPAARSSRPPLSRTNAIVTRTRPRVFPRARTSSAASVSKLRAATPAFQRDAVVEPNSSVRSPGAHPPTCAGPPARLAEGNRARRRGVTEA
jgi:hypothetical protein